MEPAELERAHHYALKILSIRKRTVRQLFHKLLDKGFGKSTIQEVIRKFQKVKLLDDEEFARGYLEDRMARTPSGKIKVSRELKAKGVSADLVHKITAEVTEECEYERALKLGKIRADYLGEVTIKRKRKKIYDYLARNGFRFSVCRDVIHRIS